MAALADLHVAGVRDRRGNAVEGLHDDATVDMLESCCPIFTDATWTGYCRRLIYIYIYIFCTILLNVPVYPV